MVALKFSRGCRAGFGFFGVEGQPLDSRKGRLDLWYFGDDAYRLVLWLSSYGIQTRVSWHLP